MRPPACMLFSKSRTTRRHGRDSNSVRHGVGPPEAAAGGKGATETRNVKHRSSRFQ